MTRGLETQGLETQGLEAQGLGRTDWSSAGSGRSSSRSEGARRAVVGLVLSGLLGLLGVAGFTGLGLWQLERLAWKTDLIARVERRVHAAPVPVPGPALWPQVSARQNEYERIELTGHYLNDRETLVEAVTGLGAGYWVLTPLRTDRGFAVLVNRGFVPPDKRDPQTREAGLIPGETAVTGLLRLSEPKGGFLRTNAPKDNRWYSRDVAAIAASRGLGDVAPFFIDASASAVAGGWPRGGLTVISFPNNHLIYALTWFCLALMLAGAMLLAAYRIWRDGMVSQAPPRV